MQPLSKTLMTAASGKPLEVLVFGETDYESAYSAMSEFASVRDHSAIDQIWLIQHPAVYTQGTACSQDTLIPSDTPVVKTDRGGQITYHGPGQLVMYPLLNLKRFGLGVKALVSALEQCVIDLVAQYGVLASRRADAPGVYVNEAKIAALGLRIRRGNSYHGLSINVDMDLSPFLNIDPCGYQGLQVTQLADVAPGDVNINHVLGQLPKRFLALI